MPRRCPTSSERLGRLVPSAKRAALLGALIFSTVHRGAGQEAVAPKAPAAPTGSVAEMIGAEVSVVFEKTRTAVVKIEAEDDHGRLSGTGFFIDPSGTLFTSYTIGGETENLVVHHGALKYPARRLYADARAGIALLKVEAATPFLVPAPGEAPGMGSPVMVIGYPMDLPLSPSFGIVAGMDLRYGDRIFATRHLRATVPVQRGQGGAPLLNMRGEIVGILISSLDQGSACFVLPIAAAEKVRHDVMCHGDVNPGWVGIEVGPRAAASETESAEIKSVIAGGPAQKAGLLAGDVILQVNDELIRGPEDVFNASFFVTADDEVKFRVARGDATVEVSFYAIKRPGAPLRTAGDVPSFAPIGTSDLRGLEPGLEE
jgi:serine protease Do